MRHVCLKNRDGAAVTITRALRIDIISSSGTWVFRESGMHVYKLLAVIRMISVGAAAQTSQSTGTPGETATPPPTAAPVAQPTKLRKPVVNRASPRRPLQDLLRLAGNKPNPQHPLHQQVQNKSSPLYRLHLRVPSRPNLRYRRHRPVQNRPNFLHVEIVQPKSNGSNNSTCR